MKSINLLGLFLFSALCCIASVTAAAPQQHAMTLSEGWRFLKNHAEDNASNPKFDDSKWQTVSIPHTWNGLDGQDGGDDYFRGVSWYRYDLPITKDMVGQRLILKFNAANQVANVYINGKHIGEHRGGYSAFSYDITDSINFNGQNLLAVKVDNSYSELIGPISADFTMYGGIYREVELLVRNPIHIEQTFFGSTGVFITTPSITKSKAAVRVQARLNNTTSKSQNVILQATVFDADNNQVAQSQSSIQLNPKTVKPSNRTLSVKTPEIWDGFQNPYLYTAKVEILDAKTKQVLDTQTESFGIRSVKFDPKRGLFINNKKTRINGICYHQHRKDVGPAVTDEMRNLDLDIIQEMGANGIRAAHYPHARNTYRLMDERGFLVWAELPQVNKVGTTQEYTDNAVQQLREMVYQNYNHPSIVCWSIANELTLRGKNKNTMPTLEALGREIEKLDETRFSAQALFAGEMMKSAFHNNTDTIGVNVYDGWYGSSKQHGKKGVYKGITSHMRNFEKSYDRYYSVSEYGGGANTQHFEYDPAMRSAGGPIHPMEYQSLMHEYYWLDFQKREKIWGTFVWNMFDFAVDGRKEGEQPGINDKGLVTHDRSTKKDAYFWYKANWSDEPVLHLTQKEYTPAPAKQIPIKVYSNCNSVNLIVNGKSLGTKTSKDFRFIWDSITLQEGTNVIKLEGQNDLGSLEIRTAEIVYDPSMTDFHSFPE
ncbi:Beta-galactosidase [Poriferisphaera corsica]|uniref:Beta-galactosidase n=1 Tax=Poriferisphaera corsica TaxID=2528020 RepID=A0A517YZ59_9BACT|nr:glycoside hydrolase family 2 TIM barrel-domain containing protein [Poriferisphaera corsica]QDU35507.1 Beta-galactosidase [Poriferisphaera corsica]